ncbi:unnamed protein product [Amoebophrya sp. A25]|nr:unnamed protein product [Amoebophrya sp. A25]|eukprot:GSA25T00022954001.1
MLLSSTSPPRSPPRSPRDEVTRCSSRRSVRFSDRETHPGDRIGEDDVASGKIGSVIDRPGLSRASSSEGLGKIKTTTSMNKAGPRTPTPKHTFPAVPSARKSVDLPQQRAPLLWSQAVEQPGAHLQERPNPKTSSPNDRLQNVAPPPPSSPPAARPRTPPDARQHFPMSDLLRPGLHALVRDPTAIQPPPTVPPLKIPPGFFPTLLQEADEVLRRGPSGGCGGGGVGSGLGGFAGSASSSASSVLGHNEIDQHDQQSSSRRLVSLVPRPSTVPNNRGSSGSSGKAKKKSKLNFLFGTTPLASDRRKSNGNGDGEMSSSVKEKADVLEVSGADDHDEVSPDHNHQVAGGINRPSTCPAEFVPAPNALYTAGDITTAKITGLSKSTTTSRPATLLKRRQRKEAREQMGFVLQECREKLAQHEELHRMHLRQKLERKRLEGIGKLNQFQAYRRDLLHSRERDRRCRSTHRLSTTTSGGGKASCNNSSSSQDAAEPAPQPQLLNYTTTSRSSTSHSTRRPASHDTRIEQLKHEAGRTKRKVRERSRDDLFHDRISFSSYNWALTSAQLLHKRKLEQEQQKKATASSQGAHQHHALGRAFSKIHTQENERMLAGSTILAERWSPRMQGELRFLQKAVKQSHKSFKGALGVLGGMIDQGKSLKKVRMSLVQKLGAADERQQDRKPDNIFGFGVGTFSSSTSGGGGGGGAGTGGAVTKTLSTRQRELTSLTDKLTAKLDHHFRREMEMEESSDASSDASDHHDQHHVVVGKKGANHGASGGTGNSNSAIVHRKSSMLQNFAENFRKMQKPRDVFTKIRAVAATARKTVSPGGTATEQAASP